jgi:uncharacterized membrane protein YeaQ/YmgE (transglycosylase-associated protein family)
MSKWDYFFIFIFGLIVSLLIVPVTRSFIGESSANHPYLMGFIKTAILATYGEMIASRILTKNYLYKKGMIYRFIIWGFLGMIFVLVFKIFDQGVIAAMNAGLLIRYDDGGVLSKLYIAFSISFFMNLLFAPAFMALHRFTDTAIDLGKGKANEIIKIKGKTILATIDWQSFYGFVVFKTIPLFWIPAHTITFLLPENYRILSAGFLSIALGLILTFSKMKRGKENETLS